MTPVLVGLAVGLAGAVAASRLLQGQLFDLSPRDPATLAAVSVVLLLAALTAAVLPSRRAAAVDHLEAMRD